MILDDNLSFSQHTDVLKSKLSRAAGILAKIRYFTSRDLLRTIYYALFDSHLRYANTIWAQSNNQNIKDISLIQRKAVRIINFENKFASINPIIKESKIVTLNNIVLLENCNLVMQHINKNLPSSFDNFFQILRNQNELNTRASSKNKVHIPQVRTTQYGLNSIKYKCATNWNNIQNNVDFNFNEEYLSINKFTEALKRKLFS